MQKVCHRTDGDAIKRERASYRGYKKSFADADLKRIHELKPSIWTVTADGEKKRDKARM
jgi:hypothetical protein